MALSPFRLGEDRLTPAILAQLAGSPHPALATSTNIKQRVQDCRADLEKAMARGGTIYGVNTGFGFLSDVSIDKSQLKTLQTNIIRSHACGVGQPSPDEVVRALLILRAHTFCLGHSAVRWDVVEQVLSFLKHDILPVIPCQGSVGASGDLAPLSHLALGLIGEGDVRWQGNIVDADKAMKDTNLKPLVLEAKEGLALINGTHYMCSVAAFVMTEAKNLARAADGIAALSLDATRGTLAAMDERIHQIRHQVGQRKVAAFIRTMFAGEDQIVDSHKDCSRVQDPYSFRCIPQVHGATWDTLAHVETILERELNSVTDNPLVFEDGVTLSGGNFHGQPVALVMDFLCIAMAELGSISERRTDKLTNPHMNGGLPAFLARDSGLQSGFMIPQVVAAALVSENKILCHPASVDSVPTSADKEDHVSMGPIAARKARQVLDNIARILAIESLAAAQGIDLLAPLKPSPALQTVHKAIRTKSAPITGDRSLSKDFESVASWLIKGGLSDFLPN